MLLLLSYRVSSFLSTDSFCLHSSKGNRGQDRDNPYTDLSANKQGVKWVPVHIAARADCRYTTNAELYAG